MRLGRVLAGAASLVGGAATSGAPPARADADPFFEDRIVERALDQQFGGTRRSIRVAPAGCTICRAALLGLLVERPLNNRPPDFHSPVGRPAQWSRRR